MTSFRKYLEQELNKSSDNLVKDKTIKPVTNECDNIVDLVSKCNPNTWTAREIENIKYLVYNKKYLNLTALKKKITEIYELNGYSNYGFSKLSEHELVRYTTVKNILMNSFNSEISDELDINYLANKFFIKELKDFDWRPENYE